MLQLCSTGGSSTAVAESALQTIKLCIQTLTRAFTHDPRRTPSSPSSPTAMLLAPSLAIHNCLDPWCTQLRLARGARPNPRSRASSAPRSPGARACVCERNRLVLHARARVRHSQPNAAPRMAGWRRARSWLERGQHARQAQAGGRRAARAHTHTRQASCSCRWAQHQPRGPGARRCLPAPATRYQTRPRGRVWSASEGEPSPLGTFPPSGPYPRDSRP